MYSLKLLFKETLVHTHQQFILGQNFAKCQIFFQISKKRKCFFEFLSCQIIKSSFFIKKLPDFYQQEAKNKERC
jgi:hypothetical protein